MFLLLQTNLQEMRPPAPSGALRVIESFVGDQMAAGIYPEPQSPAGSSQDEGGGGIW